MCDWPDQSVDLYFQLNCNSLLLWTELWICNVDNVMQNNEESSCPGPKDMISRVLHTLQCSVPGCQCSPPTQGNTPEHLLCVAEQWNLIMRRLVHFLMVTFLDVIDTQVVICYFFCFWKVRFRFRYLFSWLNIEHSGLSGQRIMTTSTNRSQVTFAHADDGQHSAFCWVPRNCIRIVIVNVNIIRHSQSIIQLAQKPLESITCPQIVNDDADETMTLTMTSSSSSHCSPWTWPPYNTLNEVSMSSEQVAETVVKANAKIRGAIFFTYE